MTDLVRQLTDGIPVEVQVRHAQAPVAATLRVLEGGGARITFAQPVFAAAPGQAIVAWHEDAVLCGGPITRVLAGGA